MPLRKCCSPARHWLALLLAMQTSMGSAAVHGEAEGTLGRKHTSAPLEIMNWRREQWGRLKDSQQPYLTLPEPGCHG